jgi:hypothetical protein
MEKSAAKEIRETARVITKLEKSVDRVKSRALKVQPNKVKS